MNSVDRFIRDRRISRVVQRVGHGARVFDIGCHDGALFRALGNRLQQGVGYDPDLDGEVVGPNYILHRGIFPADVVEPAQSFDAVSCLAVLEHVEGNEIQRAFAAAIARLLKPGGAAILTVPSPAVDRILAVGMRLHVLHGMEVDAHHGFDLGQVVPLFTAAGLELVAHERFQFGLNNLFEFHKPGRACSPHREMA